MSQSLVPSLSAVDPMSAVGNPSSTNEFHYAPVSPMAPIAAFLGVVSLLALLSYLFVPVAFFGAILSLFAIRSIAKSDGELRGTWMAAIGLVLCSTLCASGAYLEYNAYMTEVPEGHRRVNFPVDISKKEFEYVNGRRTIPKDVTELLEKKIFIKGWMMPSMRSQGLNKFVLIKDSGDCCFGGDPKAFDHIEVTLGDGQTTDAYGTGMIFVTGTLHANPDVPEDETVYTMDGTDCGLVRSHF